MQSLPIICSDHWINGDLVLSLWMSAAKRPGSLAGYFPSSHYPLPTNKVFQISAELYQCYLKKQKQRLIWVLSSCEFWWVLLSSFLYSFTNSSEPWLMMTGEKKSCCDKTCVGHGVLNLPSGALPPPNLESNSLWHFEIHIFAFLTLKWEAAAIFTRRNLAQILPWSGLAIVVAVTLPLQAAF